MGRRPVGDAVDVCRIIMPKGENRVLITVQEAVNCPLNRGILPASYTLDRDTARQFADALTDLLDEWSLEDQGLGTS